MPGPTLAVFAHFDPGGVVAPHVERYLASVAEAVDRLVVVSTATDLRPEARAAIERHGELVTRENVGYDFYSWKTGLDHAGDWDRFSRVLICNDSVVGPVRPISEIFANAPREADFWGMTASHEISPHVQSWFVVFERPVIRSGLLHGFWTAMEPVSNRYVVIRRYEVGLSRLLLTAGLRMGSYLRLDPAAALRAEFRHRLAIYRVPKAAEAQVRPPGGFLEELRAPFTAPRWNPTYVLWDAVFDGRLPFVKMEVLRDDPYQLGREAMLGRLEQAYPAEMAGVREYLDRTREEFRKLRGLHPVDPLTGAPADRAGKPKPPKAEKATGADAALGDGGDGGEDGADSEAVTAGKD